MGVVTGQGGDTGGNNTSLTHLPSAQRTRSAGQANNKQRPITRAHVRCGAGVCVRICVYPGALRAPEASQI